MNPKKKILPIALSLMALSFTSFFPAQDGQRGLASCDEVAPQIKDASYVPLLVVSDFLNQQTTEQPMDKTTAFFYDHLTRVQYEYLSMNQSIRDSYGLKSPQFGANYNIPSLAAAEPVQNYAHTSPTWGSYLNSNFALSMFPGTETNLRQAATGLTIPSPQINLMQLQPMIPMWGMNIPAVATKTHTFNPQ